MEKTNSMTWTDVTSEFQSTTVEKLAEQNSYLRLYTFPGTYYYFVYNTVDLTVTVYESNRMEDYMFNVNSSGVGFITPSWLRLKVEEVIKQHRGIK
jgi:hypothetical protein